MIIMLFIYIDTEKNGLLFEVSPIAQITLRPLLSILKPKHVKTSIDLHMTSMSKSVLSPSPMSLVAVHVYLPLFSRVTDPNESSEPSCLKESSPWGQNGYMIMATGDQKTLLNTMI